MSWYGQLQPRPVRGKLDDKERFVRSLATVRDGATTTTLPQNTQPAFETQPKSLKCNHRDTSRLVLRAWNKYTTYHRNNLALCLDILLHNGPVLESVSPPNISARCQRLEITGVLFL